MSKPSFKERIAEIRRLVFGDAVTATTPAPVDAMQSYTTADGTTVKIDKLETGGKVYGEDGTTPVTGDITLQDGTMVSIDTTGTITAVAAPAPDPAMTPGQMAMAAAANFLKRIGFAAAEEPVTSVQSLFAKFANGTPEERIGNLESMCAALMQYSFGWKIEEANRQATEAAAINAFKALAAPAQQQFAEQLATEQKARQTEVTALRAAFQQTLDLVLQLADEPAADAVHKPADKGEAPGKKERAQRILIAAKHSAATRE